MHLNQIPLQTSIFNLTLLYYSYHTHYRLWANMHSRTHRSEASCSAAPYQSSSLLCQGHSWDVHHLISPLLSVSLSLPFCVTHASLSLSLSLSLSPALYCLAQLFCHPSLFVYLSTFQSLLRQFCFTNCHSPPFSICIFLFRLNFVFFLSLCSWFPLVTF